MHGGSDSASPPRIAGRTSAASAPWLSCLLSAGLVTLTAFVSPYRRDREAVRRQVDEQGLPGDFVEVFVDAPLESLRVA